MYVWSVHTALVPDPSSFEVEIPVAKLKKYNLPGTDQILLELIQLDCETWREIHQHINFFVE
jgi:hypothetical protein